jgi:thiamine-phosphate pyrophosphorylase
MSEQESGKNPEGQGRPEIERLMYISQATERHSHLEMIRAVCEAGCTWIQLRMKDASESELFDTARDALEICKPWGAKLIINDNPHVALATGADGVHLGKNDMSPEKARDLLGDGFVIGGTANTLEDIEAYVVDGFVDYIGLGPLRFTETKQNLSPQIGLEGYRPMMIQCGFRDVEIPIFAIGGVQTDDILELRAAGVYGVAISGLITRSARKATLIKQIYALLGGVPENEKHGSASDRREDI